MIPPFFHQRISFSAVTDPKYKNFIALHSEHDSIISYPELPVILQGLAQGFAVFLGRRQEAGFYSPFHPFPDVTV